jgi:hypothetical protein
LEVVLAVGSHCDAVRRAPIFPAQQGAGNRAVVAITALVLAGLDQGTEAAPVALQEFGGHRAEGIFLQPVGEAPLQEGSAVGGASPPKSGCQGALISGMGKAGSLAIWATTEGGVGYEGAFIATPWTR